MAPITPDLPAAEVEIIALTNAFRAGKKLGGLRPNSALTAAARAYATYLAKNGKFSHTADGHEAGDRVTAAGYAWCGVAENLASQLDSSGFETRALATKSVEGWINSPGHRDNMLAPHMTETGVGIASDPTSPHPKYVTVQLFARPKSLQYEFQISNAAAEPITYSFRGETQEIAAHAGVRYTACDPATLTFDRIGTGAKVRPVAARFEASDGVVYVVMPDAAKGITVEIEPLEKVR